MRICECLIKAVRDAAVFNPEVQVAPACILWPDRDRQWEAVIPILQAELPELMILGDYAPDKRIGPAIWLRCVRPAEPRMFRCPRTGRRFFICRASAAKTCGLWKVARII